MGRKVSISSIVYSRGGGSWWELGKLSVYKLHGNENTVPVQTSDFTKVGQYKRRTYKRRTGTNVGQVQTSD